MSQYTTTIDTAGVAAYPVGPQVTIPFEPKEIVFQGETAAKDHLVSFDGVNDSARVMDPAANQVGSRVVITGKPYTKIWLKAGPATGGVVRITATR